MILFWKLILFNFYLFTFTLDIVIVSFKFEEILLEILPKSTLIPLFHCACFNRVSAFFEESLFICVFVVDCFVCKISLAIMGIEIVFKIILFFKIYHYLFILYDKWKYN